MYNESTQTRDDGMTQDARIDCLEAMIERAFADMEVMRQYMREMR